MVIVFSVFTNVALADKIHLKSGKILEGKLKENKNSDGIVEMTKKVFIQTWGCPYVASLHDDFESFKEDKWLGVNTL